MNRRRFIGGLGASLLAPQALAASPPPLALPINLTPTLQDVRSGLEALARWHRRPAVERRDPALQAKALRRIQPLLDRVMALREQVKHIPRRRRRALESWLRRNGEALADARRAELGEGCSALVAEVARRIRRGRTGALSADVMRALDEGAGPVDGALNVDHEVAPLDANERRWRLGAAFLGIGLGTSILGFSMFFLGGWRIYSRFLFIGGGFIGAAGLLLIGLGVGYLAAAKAVEEARESAGDDSEEPSAVYGERGRGGARSVPHTPLTSAITRHGSGDTVR